MTRMPAASVNLGQSIAWQDDTNIFDCLAFKSSFAPAEHSTKRALRCKTAEQLLVTVVSYRHSGFKIKAAL